MHADHWRNPLKTLLYTPWILAAAVCGPAYSQGREFNPRTVIAKGFRPIVDAPVMSAEQAIQLRPNELVLGVSVAGNARAYPINMLTGPSREIINDTLGGKAIAATW